MFASCELVTSFAELCMCILKDPSQFLLFIPFSIFLPNLTFYSVSILSLNLFNYIIEVFNIDILSECSCIYLLFVLTLQVFWCYCKTFSGHQHIISFHPLDTRHCPSIHHLSKVSDEFVWKSPVFIHISIRNGVFKNNK